MKKRNISIITSIIVIIILIFQYLNSDGRYTGIMYSLLILILIILGYSIFKKK